MHRGTSGLPLELRSAAQLRDGLDSPERRQRAHLPMIKEKKMKKAFLLIGIVFELSSAYCEIGTRQSLYWNGGCRYDFWTGEFCRG